MGQRIYPEEETMKCVICKTGETKPGVATITLERGAMTLVVKNVPARVCARCGEEYLDDETLEALEKTADVAMRSGVMVEVRDYKAA